MHFTTWPPGHQASSLDQATGMWKLRGQPLCMYSFS